MTKQLNNYQNVVTKTRPSLYTNSRVLDEYRRREGVEAGAGGEVPGHGLHDVPPGIRDHSVGTLLYVQEVLTHFRY